jgi:hypothetical protein
MLHEAKLEWQLYWASLIRAVEDVVILQARDRL